MKESTSTDIIVTILTLTLFFGILNVLNTNREQSISNKFDAVNEQISITNKKIEYVHNEVQIVNTKISKFISIDKLADPIVKKNLSDNDLKQIDCLAKNIYFEARNQSIEGQAAVAFVTFNRANTSEFPDSICKVVYQGKQIKTKKGYVYLRNKCNFSWVCDGKPDLIKNKNSWDLSYRIAYNFYIKNQKIKDPTDGSLYYHADYVKPFWAKKMIKMTKIGLHIFYKEKNG